jgi:cell division protein FtsB
MATRKKRTPIITPIQFAAIVTVTISLTLLVGFAYKINSYEQIKQEAQRLQDKLERVEADNQALLTRKAFVQTDAYVEKVAREELNFGRFGDTVVMVKNVPAQRAGADLMSGPDAGETAAATSPPWRAWYELFFGEPPEAYGF